MRDVLGEVLNRVQYSVFEQRPSAFYDGVAPLISFVGGATVAGTSVALPAHQAGDFILFYAGGTTNTIPTVPAGFETLNAGSALSTAISVGAKFATSNAEVSGVWTDATAVGAMVFRGVGSVGAVAVVTGTNTLVIPGLNLVEANDASWVAAMSMVRSNAFAAEVAPVGLVTRNGVTATTCELLGFDTNGPVPTWAAVNGADITGVRHRSVSVELLPL